MPNPTATGNATERTFREAYGVLQQHAETLRDQSEPNIDDLLTIVTESVEAYQVCKERIDAVEAALKAALEGAGVGAASAPTSADPAKSTLAAAQKVSGAGRSVRAGPPPLDNDSGDDDIPF